MRAWLAGRAILIVSCSDEVESGGQSRPLGRDYMQNSLPLLREQAVQGRQPCASRATKRGAMSLGRPRLLAARVSIRGLLSIGFRRTAFGDRPLLNPPRNLHGRDDDDDDDDGDNGDALPSA